MQLPQVASLVGDWRRHQPERHFLGATPAPACSTGSGSAFGNEFVELRQRLVDRMGEALECPRADPATGDRVQSTTTGLAIYRAHSHVAVFTDGYRHWALDARGLITWEGDGTDPPD